MRAPSFFWCCRSSIVGRSFGHPDLLPGRSNFLGRKRRQPVKVIGVHATDPNQSLTVRSTSKAEMHPVAEIVDQHQHDSRRNQGEREPGNRDYQGHGADDHPDEQRQRNEPCNSQSHDPEPQREIAERRKGGYLASMLLEEGGHNRKDDSDDRQVKQEQRNRDGW